MNPRLFKLGRTLHIFLGRDGHYMAPLSRVSQALARDIHPQGVWSSALEPRCLCSQNLSQTGALGFCTHWLKLLLKMRPNFYPRVPADLCLQNIILKT